MAMRLNKLIIFSLAFHLFLNSMPLLVQSQEFKLRTTSFNLVKGLAIQGYDPVAYFSKGKAMKGLATISYTFQGVVYHFSSSSNRDLFAKSPEKYEPQYGGWCAYAMGNSGEKVEVDPESYKIVDGKLFLFYDSFINHTLKKWNLNQEELNRKADINWRKYFKL